MARERHPWRARAEGERCLIGGENEVSTRAERAGLALEVCKPSMRSALAPLGNISDGLFLVHHALRCQAHVPMLADRPCVGSCHTCGCMTARYGECAANTDHAVGRIGCASLRPHSVFVANACLPPCWARAFACCPCRSCSERSRFAMSDNESRASTLHEVLPQPLSPRES